MGGQERYLAQMDENRIFHRTTKKKEHECFIRSSKSCIHTCITDQSNNENATIPSTKINHNNKPKSRHLHAIVMHTDLSFKLKIRIR